MSTRFATSRSKWTEPRTATMKRRSSIQTVAEVETQRAYLSKCLAIVRGLMHTPVSTLKLSLRSKMGSRNRWNSWPQESLWYSTPDHNVASVCKQALLSLHVHLLGNQPCVSRYERKREIKCSPWSWATVFLCQIPDQNVNASVNLLSTTATHRPCRLSDRTTIREAEPAWLCHTLKKLKGKGPGTAPANF